MIYDRLAESIKSKIGRLESPDPRFLRYASPHPVVTDHTAILSSPETRITTLPNGLRVATESNLSASTASIGVWIDARSRFEREKVNGVSNLLNRLVLKGKGDNARVLEEMENIGGQLNGFTSREMIGYHVNLMNQSVAKGVEILADVFQSSNFSESVISRERELIIREREKVAEVADEVVFEHLHSTAFQYVSPKSVLGLLPDNTKRSGCDDLAGDGSPGSGCLGLPVSATHGAQGGCGLRVGVGALVSLSSGSLFDIFTHFEP